jgi:hypothetical protein
MHAFRPAYFSTHIHIKYPPTPMHSDGTVVLLGRDLMEEKCAFEEIKLRAYGRLLVSQKQQQQKDQLLQQGVSGKSEEKEEKRMTKELNGQIIVPAAADADNDGDGNGDIDGEALDLPMLERMSENNASAEAVKEAAFVESQPSKKRGEVLAAVVASAALKRSGGASVSERATSGKSISSVAAEASTKTNAKTLSAASSSQAAAATKAVTLAVAELESSLPAAAIALRDIWKTRLPFPICGVSFGRHVQSAQLLLPEQGHGRWNVPKTLTVTTTKTIHVMVPRFTAEDE